MTDKANALLLIKDTRRARIRPTSHVAAVEPLETRFLLSVTRPATVIADSTTLAISHFNEVAMNASRTVAYVTNVGGTFAGKGLYVANGNSTSELVSTSYYGTSIASPSINANGQVGYLYTASGTAGLSTSVENGSGGVIDSGLSGSNYDNTKLSNPTIKDDGSFVYVKAQGPYRFATQSIPSTTSIQAGFGGNLSQNIYSYQNTTSVPGLWVTSASASGTIVGNDGSGHIALFDSGAEYVISGQLTNVSAHPSITSDGSVAAFYGVNGTSPGIYLYIGGNTVKIAGVSGDGNLDPGEVNDSAAPDGSNSDVGIFSGFDATSRVVVAGTSSDAFVSFVATGTDGIAGIYSVEVKRSALGGYDYIDHSVVKLGDKVGYLSGSVVGFNTDIYDSLSINAKGEVAASVNLSDGSSAVVRLEASKLNVDVLRKVMGPGLTLANAERYISPLDIAMEKYEITTPARQAAFLGQIGPETAGLTLWSEQPRPLSNPDPKAYFDNLYSGGNSIGQKLGNVPNTDDGYDYRGSGPLQLTGRLNFSDAQADTGYNIVDDPDLVRDSNNPIVGMVCGAWYFSRHTAKGVTSNQAADAITAASPVVFTATFNVTYIVNGGYNQLMQRYQATQRAVDLLDALNPNP